MVRTGTLLGALLVSDNLLLMFDNILMCHTLYKSMWVLPLPGDGGGVDCGIDGKEKGIGVRREEKLGGM